MCTILKWPCQLFIGNVNKVKSKCLCSHFTDSGMFYTLWQELVWGFTALHKYLYLKSAKFLFWPWLMDPFKARVFPLQLRRFITNDCRVLHGSYFHMSAMDLRWQQQVIKSCTSVKVRPCDKMTWDVGRWKKKNKKKNTRTKEQLVLFFVFIRGQHVKSHSTGRTKKI